MTMNHRLLKLFTFAAACSVALALASPAFSQWSFHRFDRGDVEGMVRQAAIHTDRFVVTLNRTGSEDADRNDRMLDRARDLERQVGVVREEFERANDYRDLRADVSNALSIAQDINREMRYRRPSYEAERQWFMLRSDLNRLARAYNLRQIG